MGFHRRRNNYYRYRFVIPAITAFAVGLLLLVPLLLFLACSPNYWDQIPHHSLINADVHDVNGDSVSRVQIGVWRSKRELWSTKNSRSYHGCSSASEKFLSAKDITSPDRYLMIATSGGLNQQRTGIVDAVVAARILNATLVVPQLDQKSFWKDVSNFSEIFDVDWFISSLSDDVKIIKEIPKKGGNTWTPRRMRVPRKCNERCYKTRVLPVLLKKHAVKITKFDYRLSNKLSKDFQKLRCRVNYHGLKFTDPILEMGKKLVHRMRMKSNHYIALHLRFEPDMLAFSGCYYGGGDKERQELSAIRKRWKTLHKSNPDRERRQGRCPLTPEEVGLMLRALGYGRDVHIYVASGEVYGGEKALAPLKALFPNFFSKDTITTKEELELFSPFSSRMAALDFIVCDESDVFVTNNNGNMAKIIAGKRRYFGHKPTIRPNARKLYPLFLNKANMTWKSFSSKVQTYQIGFMGEANEVKPGRGQFHENPSTCICESSEGSRKYGTRSFGKAKYAAAADNNENTDDEHDEPEELSDPDEEEDPVDYLLDKGMFNGTFMDYDEVASEEPELESILSD